MYTNKSSKPASRTIRIKQADLDILIQKIGDIVNQSFEQLQANLQELLADIEEEKARKEYIDSFFKTPKQAYYERRRQNGYN